MAYVYKHIRNDCGAVFYIGIGSDVDYKRACQKHQRNKFWHAITNKTSYSVEIIEDGLTWEAACTKEAAYIILYGRRDIGTGTLCNLTSGGEGTNGCIKTEETRLKLSKANTGKVISEKTKKILNDINKGNTYARGYKHSLLAKFKMKQHKKTEAHLAKIRTARLGQRNSVESIEKTSAAIRKPVIDTKSGVEYNSVTQASLAHGLRISTLTRYLNGTRVNKTNLKYKNYVCSTERERILA